MGREFCNTQTCDKYFFFFIKKVIYHTTLTSQSDDLKSSLNMSHIMVRNVDVSAEVVSLGSMSSTFDSVNTKTRCGCSVVNVRSTHGQLIQLLKMVTLTLVPTTILVVFTGIALVDALNYDKHLQALTRSTEESKLVGNFVHYLQLELEEVTIYLSSGNHSVHHVRMQFVLTDDAFQELSSWPAEGIRIDGIVYSRGNFSIYLAKYRQCVVDRSKTVANAIQFYERLNLVFIEWFTDKLQDESHRGDIWQDLLALKYIMRAKENSVIVMAYGLEYFIDNNLPHHDYLAFVRNDALSNDHLQSCFRFSSEATYFYYKQLREFERQWQYIAQVKQAIKDGHSNINVQGTRANQSWHDDFTEYLRILKDVEDRIVVHMQPAVNKEHNISRRQVRQ